MTGRTLEVRSRSTRDTERLGERLGRALRGGEFVGLSGELGAGKTAFARGFSRGAGVPEGTVSSPTFALVNAYEGASLRILHADLYRVSDADELYAAGFYDLLTSGAALLVEWIDRVPEAAPADWLEIRIERAAPGRRLSLTAHGPAADALLSRARLASDT